MNSYKVTVRNEFREHTDIVPADGFEVSPLGYVFYHSVKDTDGKPTATAVAAYAAAHVVSVAMIQPPAGWTPYDVSGSTIDTLPVEPLP